MIDYQFYNANPLGNIELDCVCRAISKATDIEYYKIKDKLYHIGKLFECDSLCVCCYHHLLENVFGFKPKFANGKRVIDIAKDYPNNNVIIRIEGHLTCAIRGVIHDIWDCTKEIADIFWIIA